MSTPNSTNHRSESLSRRRLLQSSLAVGGLLATGRVHAIASEVNSASPAEKIGVGIIGAGGRGNELARAFKGNEGATIVAAADPDLGRAEKMGKQYGANAYQDLRKLLDDPAVDVVAIATCNHWHCLAAVMAMQAGKDVYVEKPLSHTQWEGRQVVLAARKLDRIVQLGTQQRSDPMQTDLKNFLHQQKELGDIQYAQANRLGVRKPIGRQTDPLQIPKNVDYDLWCGPAAEESLFRPQLHYDWHWDWNTGSGEMGNWGVHVLDDVRNVAYEDSVTTPSKIFAVGNRVVWDDAANTPNVHYAIFETTTFPTIIALSNLEAAPDKLTKNWSTQSGRPVGGPSTGYVVACEGGYLLGQRGQAKAIDRAGKVIREFKGGNMVPLHVENFLEGVRKHDRSGLNAEIAVGHDSTGWCNLANVGFRAAGDAFDKTPQGIKQPEVWGSVVEEIETHLKPFGLTKSDLVASPVLTHNPKLEKFEGANSEMANVFLKREYRAPYAFPQIG